MNDAGFDIKTNLRAVTADLRALPLGLRREIQNALKASGDAILTEQRRILDEEPVGAVVVKTTYTKSMANRRGGYRRGPQARALAGARITALEVRTAERSRSTGLRETAAGNLTTRLLKGSDTRAASVKIATKRPDWRNKALNKKKWRHPVFGTDVWIEQAGSQYFQRGVALGIKAAREGLEAAIVKSTELIRNHPVE